MRGRKPSSVPEEVVQYAQEHPDLLQRDVAEHFNISQSYASLILRNADLSKPWRSGRPPKRAPGQTDEEYEWEIKLHELGLGLDRGMRVAGKRIVYGYDPTMAKSGDCSITLFFNL